MSVSTLAPSAEDTGEDATPSQPYVDHNTADASTRAAEAVTAPQPGDALIDDSDTDVETRTHGGADGDVDGDSEAQHTAPDEVEGEYDRVIYVPPTSVRIGDHIRKGNAEPTREEVKDYAQHGVEDAIKAYRDAEGTLVLLKGKRRLLAAIKAEVESVPVWVQPPPTEDEQAARIDRISKQYRWTHHRKGLTRQDEFGVFEQLQLEGLSVTAIGKRLSVTRRRVADSLKVGGSELASAAADKYGMTLEQSVEVAECEKLGDREAAKALIQTAAEGPHNFKTLAERLRRDRAAAEKLRKSIAACSDQLNAAGVTVLDDSIPDSDWSGQARSLDRLRPSPDHEPGTELTSDDHAICPGHSAWIRHDWDDDGDKIAVKVFGCADFRAHGHALRDVRAGWVDYNTRGTTHSAADTSDETSDVGDGTGEAMDEAMSSVSGVAGMGGVSTSVTFEDVDPEAEAAAAYAAHLAAERERRKAEIESAWVEDNTKDAEAAQAVRRAWLSGFVHRRSVPKQARKWLALRTLAGAYALSEAMDSGHPLAHRLLGLPEPELADGDWTRESAYERSELYERIETATDAKAAVYELFLMLCAFEQSFRTTSWHIPSEVDQLFIRMAIDLGYEAPDIDRKVLNPDNLEDIIAAELGTEHPDDPTDGPTDGDDIDPDTMNPVGTVEDTAAEAAAEPYVVESDRDSQPAEVDLAA